MNMQTLLQDALAMRFYWFRLVTYATL